MNETRTSKNPHNVLVTTARQVMEDVAEWWIRALLNDFNVDHFQPCLETVLPHVSPLAADSALASQFRLLCLWEEVLVNTHLQGDFAMLRDKLLLLSTQFKKTSEYDDCMDLLKVHEVLGRLYTSFSNEMISESSTNAAMDRYRLSIAGIFVGKQIPEELSLVTLSDTCSDTQEVLKYLETLVSSNTGSVKYGYDTLRDQIQALLWNWIEHGFATPTLVRLGYRQRDSSRQRHEITEENNDSATRASIATQRMADASEDDEDSDHSNENHDEQAPPFLTQQSPILLSSTEKERLAEEPLQDSEATEVVPTSKLTFAGKNRSLQGDDNESDSDDGSEVWSVRRSHARTILAPLSSRHIFKQSFDGGSVNTKRLRRPKSTQSTAELYVAEQNTNVHLHRRRHSHPQSVTIEQRRYSSPERKRKTKRPSRLRISTSPSRTNPMERQQLPEVPSLLTGGTSTRSPIMRRNDGTKPRLAPLAVRKPLVGRKRRPFSRDESLAVRNGVLKFGGDWVRIKTHYKDILVSRSLIDIKDHARILNIKGKLDPKSSKFYRDEDVVLVDV